MVSSLNFIKTMLTPTSSMVSWSNESMKNSKEIELFLKIVIWSNIELKIWWHLQIWCSYLTSYVVIWFVEIDWTPLHLVIRVCTKIELFLHSCSYFVVMFNVHLKISSRLLNKQTKLVIFIVFLNVFYVKKPYWIVFRTKNIQIAVQLVLLKPNVSYTDQLVI